MLRKHLLQVRSTQELLEVIPTQEVQKLYGQRKKSITDFQYTLRRGSRLLLYDGFSFHRDGSFNKSTFWACSKYVCFVCFL
jgi:hypothetical protein